MSKQYTIKLPATLAPILEKYNFDITVPESYLRLRHENHPFIEDMSIEVLYNGWIAFSFKYVQNGDTMHDPEIVFLRVDADQTINDRQAWYPIETHTDGAPTFGMVERLMSFDLTQQTVIAKNIPAMRDLISFVDESIIGSLKGLDWLNRSSPVTIVKDGKETIAI